MKRSCRCFKIAFTALVLTLTAAALLCAPVGLHAQAATNQPRQSPDSPAAIAALRNQAEAGDANAQVRLGFAYEHGIGVPRDVAQAISWYQKSAAQGNAHGEYSLGVMSRYGIGVQQDYAQAVSLFQQAAGQGDRDAQNDLGTMYQTGQGVQQDYAQAIAWYQKAAAQDNVIAENNLGVLYQNGTGVKRDNAMAFAWYERAASQGYPPAEENLGWMYQSGLGTKPNDMQAITWYAKAAQQGNANAENSLGWMYQNGRGLPQDYTQALALYQKSAAQGNSNAENNLGLMYQNGFGVRQDNAQAVAWYEKAIAHGNSYAKQNLDALNKEIAKGRVPPTTSASQGASNTEAAKHDAKAEEACELSKDSSDGLVIFSGTMPPGFARFSYFYESEAHSGMMKKLTEKNVSLRLEHGSLDSDFQSVSGKLFLLRLPAGAYEFHSWNYQTLMMKVVRPLGIHPLTFNVEGGHAVYLGGFDPVVIERKEGLFNAREDRPWVFVRDDQSRDLPVLFNKCPGFDRALLDIKIMDNTPWLPPQKK